MTRDDLRPAFRALLDAKRAQHPELRRPLSVLALMVVAKRERIDVLPVKLPAHSQAQAMNFLGHTAVLLNEALAPAAATAALAAALASVWLGLPRADNVRSATGDCATWTTLRRQLRGHRKPVVLASALLAWAGVHQSARPTRLRAVSRPELSARGKARRALLRAS